MSSTMGAALGGTALAPLGPVGVTAGMATGSTVAKRISQHVGRQAAAVGEVVNTTVTQAIHLTFGVILFTKKSLSLLGDFI